LLQRNMQLEPRFPQLHSFTFSPDSWTFPQREVWRRFSFGASQRGHSPCAETLA